MMNYTRAFTGTQKNYDEGLRNYMLKIYNYMTLALIVTGIAAFATLSFEPLTKLVFQISPSGQFLGHTGVGLIIMLAPLAIGSFFFFGFSKITVETAKTLFWVYSLLTGMSLASIGLAYTGESIARTFFICSSVFGAMSLYGYSTQKDLTSIGSFLIMGLIGLVLASIMNILFRSPAIEFATSLLGIAIFMGLIAWDTQKLKQIYYISGGGELGQKMSIMGAFTLYLDFINLFLHMLRFLGNRKD